MPRDLHDFSDKIAEAVIFRRKKPIEVNQLFLAI